MSIEAKVVKAEVLVNSLAFPVSHLVLTHTINELPQATFQLQIDNRGGATDINLPMFTKLCADEQEYLVNRFSTFGNGLTNAQAIDKALRADLSIRVIDGDGGTLNFSGFLSQPCFQVQQ